MIPISEFFGPTIQGEGPNAGKLTYFLRVAGCNLHCSFCDSAYTWRFNDTHPHKNSTVYNKKDEVKPWTISNLVKLLGHHNVKNLVITGGEPMLYQNDLLLVLEQLSLQRVEIETAGTIRPLAKWYNFGVHFNVSPKLASSGNDRSLAIKPSVLQEFAWYKRTAFKFVITDKKDIQEVKQIQNESNIKSSTIWLMPEGEHLKDQLKNMVKVAQLAIDNGYNFSPRLHTLLWGNERKR
jgi:7-cyano-7-deazaguanosine (preQ0) biosynthesis protein QueE